MVMPPLSLLGVVGAGVTSAGGVASAAVSSAASRLQPPSSNTAASGRKAERRMAKPLWWTGSSATIAIAGSSAGEVRGSGSARQDHQRQHRQVVAGAAGDHEQVPDR